MAFVEGMDDVIFYTLAVILGIFLILFCRVFFQCLDNVQDNFESAQQRKAEREARIIEEMTNPGPGSAQKRLQALGKLRRGGGGSELFFSLTNGLRAVRRVASGNISDDDDDDDEIVKAEADRLRIDAVAGPAKEHWRRTAQAIDCIASCNGACGNVLCRDTLAHVQCCKRLRCSQCEKIKRLISLHIDYCQRRHCHVPGCVQRRQDARNAAAAHRERKRKKPRVLIVDHNGHERAFTAGVDHPEL